MMTSAKINSGVECDRSTFFPTITKISWPYHGCWSSKQSLNWTLLPETVVYLDLSYNLFAGTLDFALFPPNLEMLFLSNNWFSGTLQNVNALTHLVSLDLYNNYFSGSIPWKEMPKGLSSLFLSNNSFSGAVNWEHLPIKMHYLFLSNNSLSGSTRLDVLPRMLISLDMYDNHFQGFANLTSLPPILQTLSLSNNNMSGSLNFTSLPLGLSHLRLASNHFSGSIRLNALPSSLVVLLLDRNQICGTAEVVNISQYAIFSVDEMCSTAPPHWQKLITQRDYSVHHVDTPPSLHLPQEPEGISYLLSRTFLSKALSSRIRASRLGVPSTLCQRMLCCLRNSLLSLNATERWRFLLSNLFYQSDDSRPFRIRRDLGLMKRHGKPPPYCLQYRCCIWPISWYAWGVIMFSTFVVSGRGQFCIVVFQDTSFVTTS
eukprot:PhF_6_TR30553/c0_g1_i3/m.44861